MVQVLVSFAIVRKLEEQITDVVLYVRTIDCVTCEREVKISFLVMFDRLLDVVAAVCFRPECPQGHC